MPKKKKTNDNIIKGERMLEFRTCAFNYVEQQTQEKITDSHFWIFLGI